MPIVAKATGPGDYINATNYNRAPLNPGLYDGPYLITGYDSGAQIVLEPNPHWAGHASPASDASCCGTSKTPRRCRPTC